MARCAAGDEGLCRPSDQVLCGRQLTASAYRVIAGDAPEAEPLVDLYAESSREAFLGLQLAAFATDADTRLQWLQSQDYPAVVTAQVRDLNEQLLEQWRTGVLDAHLGVLSGQFDAAGISVLARETSSQGATFARDALIFDMTQAFRGALDATTLAARRWDTLLQDGRDREDKADFVAAQARDLYILTGVFANLNLRAGQEAQGAVVAAGFAELQRALLKLSMSFDELIYARDAEVTVSTSLDPTRGNLTLLGDLKDEALEDLEDAAESVGRVLERAVAEALSEEELRNRLNNEIADLRADLVEMCGLPTGCTPDDLREGEPECQVDVELCGVSWPRGEPDLAGYPPEAATASEAGAALLSVKSAALDGQIARAELSAQLDRASLFEERADAFSRSVNERVQIHLESTAAIERNITEQSSVRSGAVAALTQSIASAAALRQANLDELQDGIDEWDRTKYDDVNSTYGLLLSAALTRQSAETLRNVGETINDFADATITAIELNPTDLATAQAKSAVKFALAGNNVGLRIGAEAIDWVGQSLELALERRALVADVDEEGEALQDDYDALVTQGQFDELREATEVARAQGDADAANLENLLEQLRAAEAFRLETTRDADALNDRRSAFKEQLLDIATLELRIEQAKLGIQQRILDYASVTQRARLAEAKLADLERQRDNINQLVGSPAVVFGRANRLTQAELRLDRAKSKMMDWLVGIEYFAVRPFMDLRIQILLARNTFQLEEIANRLDDIQRDCGGPVNTFTADLSLREDFLDITDATLSEVSSAPLTPPERLRAIMTEGFVPVSKRVRYRSDASVGDLMTRQEDILSATFSVSLTDFANLQNTCNAKLESLDVKLVGEGLGDALPTVTILYDGVGQLRSCQPDLDAYVAQFGRASSFGQTTILRSAGRSISPVAGVGTFPSENGSANQSLNGLPLASQYTILIDTEAGENDDIDWTRLEDVELRIAYTFQDVFPAGQCE